MVSLVDLHAEQRRLREKWNNNYNEQTKILNQTNQTSLTVCEERLKEKKFLCERMRILLAEIDVIEKQMDSVRDRITAYLNKLL
ncbi:PrGVORF9 [Pieris rapae granulovirus Wuhan]|uniref:PrGVORF9 n=1 Tax=Pieris rapae granulovirus Wuhan TaxID=2848030 RepID=D2J4H6_9BBAC|nr:PrGVORF9 [Betabaculovirus arrapae]ACZ63495.1 PrGVORF9 [Betabaculovirus arrapae]ADO85434.1 unknown [Pieris rapae granulovirus]UOS85683.1 ORF9 [Pieris rapae granulovirus]